MTTCIHPVVKNADHKDTVIFQAVEHHMRAVLEPPESWSQLFGFATQFRVLSEICEATL